MRSGAGHLVKLPYPSIYCTLPCLTRCTCCFVQAVPRLEALVRRVLLAEAGRGLLWGHRLLHRLMQLFRDFDFPDAAVLRGLQARSSRSRR